MIDEDEEGCDPCGICSLIWLVLLVVVLVLDGCMFFLFIALRAMYYLFFGLINFLPDFYSNTVAKFKVNADIQKPEDFLYYAYLR